MLYSSRKFYFFYFFLTYGGFCFKMHSSKKEHKQKSTSSGSVPSTSRTVRHAMPRLSPQREATQVVSTAEGSSDPVASDVTVSRPETEAVATS